ncbi:hypothetical protein NEAUS03_0824 [Nematocida ausubeli]|nr:hypothetical protein NEAUS03_0824 [Nematocida ausubeli]
MTITIRWDKEFIKEYAVLIVLSVVMLGAMIFLCVNAAHQLDNPQEDSSSMPDQSKNSFASTSTPSTNKEKKKVRDEMDKTQHRVDLIREGYKKGKDILNKTNNDAKLAYDIYLKNNEELVDIKKKYKEIDSEYSSEYAKVQKVKEKNQDLLQYTK